MQPQQFREITACDRCGATLAPETAQALHLAHPAAQGIFCVRCYDALNKRYWLWTPGRREV